MGRREREEGSEKQSFRAEVLAIVCALALGCLLSCGGEAGSSYDEVEPIFASKCTRCHSQPLERFQVPFDLSTYEDVYEHRGAVERAIRTGIMPLLQSGLTPPVEDLSEEEEETLLNWLADGAPE